MRKITAGPIAVFSALMVLALSCTGMFLSLLSKLLPQHPWIGTMEVMAFAAIFFLLTIFENRIILHFFPLPSGPVPQGSRVEFVYNLNLLFYLLIFYPVTCTRLVPVPLMRIIYQLLGTSMGSNSYCAGTIMDPTLTRIGANTIIGQNALLFSHAIEGQDLSLAPIRIGNGVTVGANAVIMSGVTIEDDAIVAVNAVVTKSSHIGPGEIWAGTPARKIKDRKSEETEEI